MSLLGTLRDMRRNVLALLAVMGLALFPSTAAADVLVNAIYPETVSCGQSVELGVWYQSFSGGPTWARMDVVNSRGVTVWSKDVTATTTWRFWHYRGLCGTRYTAVYATPGGTSRFPFRVR
jgi:hypothetical protein